MSEVNVALNVADCPPESVAVVLSREAVKSPTCKTALIVWETMSAAPVI